jgi:hypothetical protein
MKVIKSTTQVNNAIKKASKINQSIVPPKKPLKLQGGKNVSSNSSTSFENGTMYLCEVVSEQSPGIYVVKAYLDFTDLTQYELRYLVALELTFENVYYPGQRLVACSQQLDSFTVTS